MAIKELVHDEAVLSTPCEKATAEDAQVAQDLLDTMASLDEAACLHAKPDRRGAQPVRLC